MEREGETPTIEEIKETLKIPEVPIHRPKNPHGEFYRRREEQRERYRKWREKQKNKS